MLPLPKKKEEKGKIRFSSLIGHSPLHSSRECEYFVWDFAGDDDQLNYVTFGLI